MNKLKCPCCGAEQDPERDLSEAISPRSPAHFRSCEARGMDERGEIAWGVLPKIQWGEEMNDTMLASTKLDNLIMKLETADAESFGWLRGNVVMYLSALHQILLAEESCEANGDGNVIEEIKRVKEFL